MDVSAVIPTRNRPGCLDDLLTSLAHQTYPLSEVIIVDSSDEPLSEEALHKRHPSLPIIYLTSEASVCLQRNIGLRRVTTPLVFVCDDDMVAPSDYVAKLHAYMVDHPDVAAVSGLVAEPGQSQEYISQYPVRSVGQLLFRFVFQLSVWGELNFVQPSWLGRLPFALLKRYYIWRDNGLSDAGWPEITCFEPPAFRVRVWGLGASLLRRDCLGDQPYDEVLDPHGIGDNFDLCLRLPGKRPVAVLTEAWIEHKKSDINCLPQHIAHFRRTLSLHYFLSRYPSFSRRHRLIFLWSLLGKYLESHYHGDRERANSILKMFRLIVTGNNPYLQAHRAGNVRFVQPQP
ncbi:glycosyltransferase family 2 protein [Candidatus Entotheonella palauensis]|uniref:glycosyltransferase family 2 protein n=1 Tax=Candidatus Entotheonella palauensis TaxID=93172 RepID=UPI000B7D95EB|nr:glycosyltransferase family 2 protein [Candidatus Entotheonella palauensis]